MPSSPAPAAPSGRTAAIVAAWCAATLALALSAIPFGTRGSADDPAEIEHLLRAARRSEWRPLLQGAWGSPWSVDALHGAAASLVQQVNGDAAYRAAFETHYGRWLHTQAPTRDAVSGYVSRCLWRGAWLAASLALASVALWRWSQRLAGWRGHPAARASAVALVWTIAAASFLPWPLNPGLLELCLWSRAGFESLTPWAIGLAAATAASRLPQRWKDSAAAGIARGGDLLGSPRGIAAASGVVLGLTLCVQSAVLERVPSTTDEFLFLTLSRTLQSGATSFDAGAAAPFAVGSEYVTHEGGRAWSLGQPGWPVLLLPFDAIGAGWLAAPLLGTFAFAGFALLIRQWMGAGAAALAALLTATSPWYLLMCGTWMAHAPMLAAVVAGVWLLGRSRPVSGTMFGLAFTIRPASALIPALLVLAWLVGTARRAGTRTAVRTAARMAAGAAIPLGLWMAYNASLTGRPLQTPYEVYFSGHYGDAHGLGFSEARGQVFAFVGQQVEFEHGQEALAWDEPSRTFAALEPGHTPLKGLLDTTLNLHALANESLGWSVHAFAPAVLLLVLPHGRRRWLIAGAALAVLWSLIVYAAYWYAGVGFGARFHFEVFPALIALQVAGLVALSRVAGAIPVAMFVAVQIAASVCGMTAGAVFDPYRHNRQHDPAVFDAIAAQAEQLLPPGTGAVVFVPTDVSRVSAAAIRTAAGPVPLLGRPAAAFERANFGLWRNRFPLDASRIVWAIDWDRIARTPGREEWIAGPRGDGGVPLLGRWPANAELAARFPGRVAIRAEIAPNGTVRLTRLW